MDSIPDDSFAAVVFADAKNFSEELVEVMVKVAESIGFADFVEQKMQFVDRSLESKVVLVFESEDSCCYKKHDKGM